MRNGYHNASPRSEAAIALRAQRARLRRQRMRSAWKNLIVKNAKALLAIFLAAYAMWFIGIRFS